jgi:hypothetical protein
MVFLNQQTRIRRYTPTMRQVSVHSAETSMNLYQIILCHVRNLVFFSGHFVVTFINFLLLILENIYQILNKRSGNFVVSVLAALEASTKALFVSLRNIVTYEIHRVVYLLCYYWMD